MLAAIFPMITCWVGGAAPVNALGEPTLTWVTLDNQTDSGIVQLRATAAATTGTIAKWCLRVDGVPVSRDVSSPGDYLLFAHVSFYGTFNGTTGCWTSSGNDLRGAEFLVDSTKWADGNHTFTITVTDTSLRSTASTLNVMTVNPAPTVQWVTADATTFRGDIVLRATAATDPSGSATITKWCLTQDGVAIDANIATPGDYLVYSPVDFSSTFDATAGCWTTTGRSLTGAEFTIDATAWPNANHTYVITVTDSSGRSTTSTTLTIATNNPAPTVQWVTADATTFRGDIVLRATAATDPSGSATITKWCLTQDGVAIDANIATPGDYLVYSPVDFSSTFDATAGCWTTTGRSLTGAEFTIDATAWPNANHTYVITVTDSSGRSTTSTTLTIATDNRAPTVQWVTATGQTRAGLARLRATAAADPAGSAIVNSWCLTLDGLPVDVDISSPGDYLLYSPVAFRAAFNPATGCWTSSSGNLTGGEFIVDTSGWPDGTYSFGLTVTDSNGRTAQAPPFVMSTSNPSPTVQIVPPSAPTGVVSRTISISASAAAAATSTGFITSWCLSRDGVPFTRDVTEQVTEYGFNTVRDDAQFNPATGCWIGIVDGLTAGLTDGAFAIDTTTWTDGPHTIRLVITDSAGKSTVADIPVTTRNPLASFAINGVRTGSVLRRQAALSMTASFAADQSDLRVATWCLSIDRGPCRRPAATARTASWSINTAALRNGPHTAAFSARDSAGRLVTRPAITFTVSNVVPSVVTVSGSYNRPRIASTSATVGLSVRTTGASQITVRWGTSRTALTSSKTWTAASSNDATVTLPIGGLRFGTMYYFEVRSRNAAGVSTTKVYSLRSPPKAYKVRTICTTYTTIYLFFFVVYSHDFTYTWSSGEVTYSPTYSGSC